LYYEILYIKFFLIYSMSAITGPWTTPQKVSFRFVFLMFTLFMLIVNNGTLPIVYFIIRYPNNVLDRFIPWMAGTLLHLGREVTNVPSGSGDSTFDYLLLLCILMASVIGTVIWTAIDRKAIHYQTLYYWLTVAARYYVAFMLIHYGLIKVVKLQFASPGQTRLNEAYGDSSPMGLAWTFLGYSKGYNIFMGIAEISAAFLLFRKTAVIGAILALMVSLNIMAINFFYDVPVKIVSTALVALSIFLLSAHIGRLYKFFIAGETTALKIIEAPYIKKKWLR